MARGDGAVDAGLIVGSIADERGEWTGDLIEQRLTCEPSSISLDVSSEARICPV
jgi:hypothetical protein